MFHKEIMHKVDLVFFELLFCKGWQMWFDLSSCVYSLASIYLSIAKLHYIIRAVVFAMEPIYNMDIAIVTSPTSVRITI